MSNPMILVVEDDSTVQNLIVTALETQEYRYCTAQDGTQAILEAATQRPDIMLLDLGLPDMDGVEVIQKVRTWSDLPIIVISARSEDSDKVAALDAGADDYLAKPYSLKELIARINALAHKAKTSGLTEAELAERDALRQEYLADIRASMIDQLEHTTVIEPDGTRRKLQVRH